MSDRPFPRLHLARVHLQQMLDDILKKIPEEACGLLAGCQGRVEQVIPITNSLHSPVRFYMQPDEQLRAFQKIEQNGWDLLGIYHSHPHGPPEPSPTDVREAYYPDVAHLVWYQVAEGWQYRAFLIRAGHAERLFIHVEEEA